jgi:hypothetical protein
LRSISAHSFPFPKNTTFWPRSFFFMKMASIDCLETSAVNQPTLRNTAEHGSLRYRTVSVTVHSNFIFVSACILPC